MAKSKYPVFEGRPAVSTYQKYPEHLKAIGLITMNMGQIDIRLAEVTAALLRVSNNLGFATYFSARSATGRIEMVTNIAATSLSQYPDLASDAKGVLKRVLTLFGKRHQLIHSVWLHKGDDLVSFNPITGEAKPVELSRIQRIADDSAVLLLDLITLTFEIIKAANGRPLITRKSSSTRSD